MFSKFIRWHREWEYEILEVLKSPVLIAKVAPGYRRRVAQRLSNLSAIERRQAYEFGAKYRGVAGYAALGKLMVVMSLMGLALHLSFPTRYGLIEAVVANNLLGLATAGGWVGVWFNYRRIYPANLLSVVKVIALATCGALVGASISALVDGRSVAEMMEKTGRSLLFAGLCIGGFYSILYGAVSFLRNREHELLTTQLEMQAEQDRLARQLSESRLRLLQAQIEPHFLFNTLGAVQQLAQHESPRAAELTANLITFLRASLGDMRTGQVTLQAELHLIEAYLKVMKTRLGHRLDFALQLPRELAHLSIPGMLVLTLVENAIKHGIEPALRGGRIDVDVYADEHELHIDVRDTGAGETLPAVLGVGLTNLKERVALTYGTMGQLELQLGKPTGMVARLHLPRSRLGPAT